MREIGRSIDREGEGGGERARERKIYREIGR